MSLDYRIEQFVEQVDNNILVRTNVSIWDEENKPQNTYGLDWYRLMNFSSGNFLAGFSLSSNWGTSLLDPEKGKIFNQSLVRYVTKAPSNWDEYQELKELVKNTLAEQRNQVLRELEILKDKLNFTALLVESSSKECQILDGRLEYKA